MTNTSNTGIVRITLLLCAFFAVTTLFGGCRLDGSAGETKAEVQQKHKIIVKTQKSQMQDDWDAILLLNKSSRLSDKYVR